jgi:hypothetical protein
MKFTFKDNMRNNTPSSTYYKRNIIVDFHKLSKSNLFFDKVAELNIENIKADESSISQSRQGHSSQSALVPTLMPNTTNMKVTLENLSELLNLSNEKSLPKKLRKKKAANKKVKKLNQINESEEREEEGDDKKTNFRLGTLDNSIIKPKDMFIVDFVKEKLYGYSSIKDLQEEAHRIISETNETKLQENTENAKKGTFLTMDQRLFKKIYGNMNFSNLKAVDEAYEERDISDKQIIKQKNVEVLRENKKVSSQQIDFFKEDHIKNSQNMARRDAKLVQEAKLKDEKEFEVLKETVTNTRETNKRFNQDRRKDIMLAINFSKQHLSVSKALQKHEFLLFRENKLKSNSNFVTQQFNKQQKQHEIVKKYLEQRNLLRTVQTNADRNIVRNRIKNDNEFVETEAKKRVEYLKSLDHFNKNELNRNFSLPAINLAHQFEPEVENDYDYLRRLEESYNFYYNLYNNNQVENS